MDEKTYTPTVEEVKNAESMARDSIEKVRNEGSPLERVKLEAQLEAIEMTPAMRKVSLPNEWVDAIRDEHVNIRVAEFEERQKNNPFNIAIEAARVAAGDDNELVLISYWEEKGEKIRKTLQNTQGKEQMRASVQGGDPATLEELMNTAYLMNEVPFGALSKQGDGTIALRLDILNRAATPDTFPTQIKPSDKSLEATLKSIGVLKEEHNLDALTFYPPNVSGENKPTYYPDMRVANYIPATRLGEGVTASVDLNNNRVSRALNPDAVARFIG